MSIERWIGGINAKLQNISDKIGKIEMHLEKLNDRTRNAETDITILKMKTEKNCKNINGLGKRVDASKLTGKELEEIRQYLKVDMKTFTQEYLKNNSSFLIPQDRGQLRNGEHSCVFLNNNECIIYPARPKVCKDFGEDDCKKLKTEIGGF